jgi:hypothetical protein
MLPLVADTPGKEVLCLGASEQVDDGLDILAAAVVKEVCEEGGANLADRGRGAFRELE